MFLYHQKAHRYRDSMFLKKGFSALSIPQYQHEEDLAAQQISESFRPFLHNSSKLFLAKYQTFSRPVFHNMLQRTYRVRWLRRVELHTVTGDIFEHLDFLYPK